ncbi:MAG: hypothetical protein JWP78_2625 [Mucilaginibacter sp.]|nr:hypothetical protein [Mucilaginibacter sp.]
MEELPLFFRLYCTNIQCKKSICVNISDIRLPLNEANLLTEFICHACKMLLVSVMDIELKQITAEVGVSLPI